MEVGTFLLELKDGHKDRVLSIVDVGDVMWSSAGNGAIFLHDKEGELVRELQIPSRGLTLDYATCMVKAGSEIWCGMENNFFFNLFF